MLSYPPDGTERLQRLKDGGSLWLHRRCEEAYERRRFAEEGIAWTVPGSTAPLADKPVNGNGHDAEGSDPAENAVPPQKKKAAPPPAPDRIQIETFVQALFKHATAGNWVSLRAFLDQGGSSQPFRITPIKLNGDLDVLIDRAYRDAELAARNHEKVVFCPPIATFNNSKHAREADLAEGLVLSTECDKAAPAARVKLEAVLGPATLVVAERRRVDRSRDRRGRAETAYPSPAEGADAKQGRAPHAEGGAQAGRHAGRGRQVERPGRASRSAGRAACIARRSRSSAASSPAIPTPRSISPGR